MASSMLLRRTTTVSSFLTKLLQPVRSTVATTRYLNTNTQMRDHGDTTDEERSIDIDRRQDQSISHRAPTVFSGVFDPFYPTRSLNQVLNMMDQLMDVDPVRRGFTAPVSAARRGWDVKESEDGLHFRIDMPGLGKDNVNVSVEENTLIIKGKARRSLRRRRVEGDIAVGLIFQ
ncbi:hypothetical protein GIB67_007931 [Kingdonia uniflora]|uniref:SHSP domain-containing protein n=1 Tax=Kingdonia uniflora TaxID=39325 RepID=A0A7J7M9I4_9MAGN|nr:hypothetical protein GIB67_007931 [Kingdonia uniflora]